LARRVATAERGPDACHERACGVEDPLASARPLGFDALDTNLYRYVRNDPTREPDQLGLFTYQWKPGTVKFLSSSLYFRGPVKGLRQIGYASLFLDIKYSQVRRNISFIQVNTVKTIVVTVDPTGKIAAKATTRYFEDATDASGKRLFPDRLGGPDFDISLRPDAVIVWSHVSKEHGLVSGNIKEVRGAEVTEDRAKTIRGMIGGANCPEMGEISYDYYWSDIDTATARKAKAEDVVKELEKASGAEELKSFVKAVIGKNGKIDLKTFNGQFLISESGTSIVGKEESAGLFVEADLEGSIKK
jgi:hypothetical protein